MIQTGKIRQYLALLQARGLAPRRLLAGTGLRLQQVADATCRIEPEQHDAMLLNLLHLTGESDLAFTLGSQMELADLGIVGYAMHSSRTLRDALGLWLEYSNSLIGSPLRLMLAEREGGGWDLAIACFAGPALLRRYYVEEFLVSGVALFGLLAGQAPVLTGLSLAYPAPPHRARYEQLFACPIQFGADQTVFSVTAPGLDTPIRSNNEELNQIIALHCRQILQQLPRGGGFEPRLRSLFLTRSSQLPGMDAAAQQLGCSQRTLRRRLQGNGRSYRHLKHDFRLDLAMQYLDQPHLGLKEIAHLLGYTSASAFCRAFKGWTGQTPGEYRQPAVDGAGQG